MAVEDGYRMKLVKDRRIVVVGIQCAIVVQEMERVQKDRNL